MIIEVESKNKIIVKDFSKIEVIEIFNGTGVQGIPWATLKIDPLNLSATGMNLTSMYIEIDY